MNEKPNIDADYKQVRPEDEPGTFFRSSSGRSLGTPGYHTPALGGHVTPSYKMVSSIGLRKIKFKVHSLIFVTFTVISKILFDFWR